MTPSQIRHLLRAIYPDIAVTHRRIDGNDVLRFSEPFALVRCQDEATWSLCRVIEFQSTAGHPGSVEHQTLVEADAAKAVEWLVREIGIWRLGAARRAMEGRWVA